MSDSMRRFLKEEEARRRLFQNMTGTFSDYQTVSAAAKAYDDLQQQESAYMRFLKASGVDELSKTFIHHQELSAICDVVRANEMTATQQSAQQVSKLASALSATDSYDWGQVGRMATNAALHDLADTKLRNQRLGLSFEDAGFQRVAQELEQQKRFEAAFRLPLASEFASLAADVAAANSLASSSFGSLQYVDELQARMKEMREPWLSASMPSASVGAFADLQAIGYLASHNDPFGATAVAALRTALGDWREPANFDLMTYCDPILRSRRYLDHGFDPELTDFTVPAFEQSMEIAGLGWSKSPEIPESSELLEEGLARNGRAYDCIQRLEIQLRRFIESKMLAAFGDKWMIRQLPNGMLDRLREKQEAAIKAGEPSSPLMDYADFTEYRCIIERKDNWEKVFKSIFGRKEDICESFQRLFPVRIATMHARIITQDDELLLQVESRRILRVIST